MSRAIVLAAILLCGCDDGRYQISDSGWRGTVFRLDTRTGEVVLCTYTEQDESVTCK